MADGYEQDDIDIVYSEMTDTSSLSAEDIYKKLGCEALEE